MRFIRQANGQIKALTTFTLYDGRTIATGTLGGTIASPRSLSQSGTSWVFQNGKIEGNAYVSGNALVAVSVARFIFREKAGDNFDFESAEKENVDGSPALNSVLRFFLSVQYGVFFSCASASRASRSICCC